MQSITKFYGAGSLALSGFLGLTIIGLAIAVFATPMDVGALINWTEQIFGVVFIGRLLPRLCHLVSILHEVPRGSWKQVALKSYEQVTSVYTPDGCTSAMFQPDRPCSIGV